MSSTFETGHAKNVANFKQLISFCEDLGDAYHPSRKELTIEGLKNVLTQAELALTSLNNAKTAFDMATNTRREAFDSLPTFATQIVSAMGATGISALNLADAKGILRKMNGRRAGKPKATVPATTDVPQATTDKQISVSQLSYDNQVDHFSKLLSIAAQLETYVPNEKELSVAGLQAKLEALNTVNAAVVKNYTILSSARQSRNNTLYDPVQGLAAIAAGVKLYVKSVFGSTNPKYKQISAVSFVKAR